MKNKRLAFPLLIVCAFILLGLAGCQAGNALAAGNSLVGTWNGVITPDGAPSAKNVAIFSSDGTLTLMEGSGVVGLGVWEKVSGNQYSFTIVEYFLEEGANFQAKVRGVASINEDKESYTGPFHFQISDLEGNVLQEGTGVATFVRMHVEPMP